MVDPILVPKGRTERFQITVETFRGTKFVDLRVYYEDDAGAWRPTKKGVAIKPELVPQIVEALLRAAKAD